MNCNRIINIGILSDFENFNKNLNKILVSLPFRIKYVFINNIDELENNNDLDFVVTNKSAYDLKEIDYFCNNIKKIPILTIIDSYFKYEELFLNVDNGLIIVRRPLGINMFVEILKVLIISSLKKDKKNKEDYELINTSKIFLIILKRFTEDDAHKYLERYAMDLRISLKEASKNIISDYLKERENIKYEYKN